MPPVKKLLIISNRYPVGPDDVASPFVHDFRLALENENIRPHVVTPFYESATDEKYLDDYVHRFHWSDGTTVVSQLPLWNPLSGFKVGRYLRSGFKLAGKILERHDCDAVLALWAAPSGIIARKLHLKYGVPYAVWALGSDINHWATRPVVGRIITRVLREADILYADGYQLALRTRRLTDRNCHFMPSFHRLGITAPLDGRGRRRLLYVGRIETAKGIFDLIDAFEIFRRENPRWSLAIVGTGRAGKSLRETIESRKLAPAVSFHGFLPRQKIDRLLTESTAVVIPSHSDSLPLTFGEAMQAGRPVICSDVGDMPYFVDTFGVGCHFPAGDWEKLAACLALMAADDRDFRSRCRRVTEELDIAKSAGTVAGWLETLKPEKPHLVTAL